MINILLFLLSMYFLINAISIEIVIKKSKEIYPGSEFWKKLLFLKNNMHIAKKNRNRNVVLFLCVLFCLLVYQFFIK